MGKNIEIGKRYGSLLVIDHADRDDEGKQRWLCKCDCGNFIEVRGYMLGFYYITSCGCRGGEISSSVKEKFISEKLREVGCYFLREKDFNELRGEENGYLRFDFYIPDRNLCIEYNGVQHTLPLHGEEKLKQIQKSDELKNEFCKRNGINLERLTATDLEDRLNEIIEAYNLRETPTRMEDVNKFAESQLYKVNPLWKFNPLAPH